MIGGVHGLLELCPLRTCCAHGDGRLSPRHNKIPYSEASSDLPLGLASAEGLSSRFLLGELGSAEGAKLGIPKYTPGTPGASRSGSCAAGASGEPTG